MKLRPSTKDYIREAAIKSRILDLAERFVAPSATVLMYHSVVDDPHQFAGLIGVGITHSSAVFRRHMEIIAREFVPVTLDDIVLFLNGEATLPRRAVVVTFDDGFADNCEIAAPILNHFGIRAAFYATVDLIGTHKIPWYSRLRHAFATTRKTEWRNATNGTVLSWRDPNGREAALHAAFDLCAATVASEQEMYVREIERSLEAEPPVMSQRLMMSWDQLRKLQSSGHIVGSHTLTHPNVAFISDDNQRRELVESKRLLENELGSEVAHFSYPHPALNPQWTEQTIRMTSTAGYRSATTTTRGRVFREANPLCLNRVHAPHVESRFRWSLSVAILGAQGRNSLISSNLGG